MNLLSHMHSFHSKQSQEAKQERIERMRRARSMPKLDLDEVSEPNMRYKIQLYFIHTLSGGKEELRFEGSCPVISARRQQAEEGKVSARARYRH